MPKDGVCCDCGDDDSGDTIEPCHSRDDRLHCEHWWELYYQGVEAEYPLRPRPDYSGR